ncbi:MAG TPA: hypothetical protein VGF06_12785 [Terriglobales bacterium]|jgi:hypothetical protein
MRQAAICIVVAFATLGFAQGHGHGHDKHRETYHSNYSNHDREVIHGWYHEHENHLPPGLAKKDRLPPGLERQLLERGTLPPGLRKKVQPCPVELERRLPPPPPGYAHTVISGHIVLMNRKTYAVLDVVQIFN